MENRTIAISAKSQNRKKPKKRKKKKEKTQRAPLVTIVVKVAPRRALF
jgi:hypothetical protein